jgi:hypothetical protein
MATHAQDVPKVDMVHEHANLLLCPVLHPGRHVELDLGSHVDFLLAVCPRDCVRAVQTRFFARIPVELDRTAGSKVRCNKASKRLQVTDRPRTVVVRARCREFWVGVVAAVKVSPNGNDTII